MKALRICLVVVFIMSLALTVGVAGADSEENNSRIQNLTLDLQNETEARIEADNDLQNQINGLPGGPGSGYVSVPFIPSWNFDVWYADVIRVYCYWAGPPVKWHNMNGAYCDTSVNWSGWMAVEEDPSLTARFFTPVQLPDGATITSFQVWAYDNDPEYDGQVTFRASGPTPWGTVATVTLTPLYTSGAANVPRLFTADSINPAKALVDNSLGSFYLDSELRVGSDVVLMTAVIGYEFK